MVVEIIYETHSITTDNETGLATGWLPGQLSETGRKLAQELGRRRSADGLATVFTSDLARAVETAEIAFAGTGIPIRQDPRLRECNYGTFNGTPVSELARIRSATSESRFRTGRATRTWLTRHATSSPKSPATGTAGRSS